MKKKTPNTHKNSSFQLLSALNYVRSIDQSQKLKFRNLYVFEGVFFSEKKNFQIFFSPLYMSTNHKRQFFMEHLRRKK